MLRAKETERLLIRNFRLRDWRGLRDLILRYQASGYAIYDHQWPTSEQEIRGVVKWFAAGDSYFAVVLKATRSLIGFVALNEAGERVYNLGYVFDPGHHRQGYATEACRAILERAFTELAAARVVSGTAEANLPSRRLLAKLGFRQTSPLAFELSREEWTR